MPTTPRTKSRIRIWVVAGFALAAIIAVIVTTSILGKSDATPSGIPKPDPTPTAQTASPTGDDPEPTGCLGGEQRDAAMILSARKQAPHTSNGAVEVAAAFVRWLNQFPYPTDADAEKVRRVALAKEAPTQDIAAFFETHPNLSGGLVDDDENYYFSTVAGVYHLESATPDTVVATIGTSLVQNGALSASLKGSITVTVKWESNGWSFVKSEGTRTTEDLFSIGKPFTEGC